MVVLGMRIGQWLMFIFGGLVFSGLSHVFVVVNLEQFVILTVCSFGLSFAILLACDSSLWGDFDGGD